MRRLCVLSMLVGCGRVSFDVVSDGGASVDTSDASDSGPMSCAQFGPWSAPQLVTALNTPNSEVDPFLTTDGLTLYFTTDRSGGREIWKTTRMSPTSVWGVPAVVPELSASGGNDGNPALTSDELQVYWGLGTFHKARRTSKSLPFSNDEVVPFGTAFVEMIGPAIAGNDLEMYIPGTMNAGGERHVLRITRPDINASFDLNTAVELPHSGEQEFPAISFDNRELIYETKTTGTYDMMRMTRTSTAVEFDLATEEPLSELNDPSADDADPTLSADGTTIIFDSTRPGGAGDFDLYTATRSCL